MKWIIIWRLTLVNFSPKRSRGVVVVIALPLVTVLLWARGSGQVFLPGKHKALSITSGPPACVQRLTGCCGTPGHDLVSRHNGIRYWQSLRFDNTPKQMTRHIVRIHPAHWSCAWSRGWISALVANHGGSWGTTWIRDGNLAFWKSLYFSLLTIMKIPYKEKLDVLLHYFERFRQTFIFERRPTIVLRNSSDIHLIILILVSNH